MFIVHYLLKALLNVILATFVLGICLLLCSAVVPLAELEAVLTPANLFQHGVQYIPFVGGLADTLLDMLGLRLNVPVGSEISTLSDATFAILLVLIYKCLETLHLGIRTTVNRVAKTSKFFVIFTDVICYTLTVGTAIASALMLNTLITKYLSPAGYAPWAVLIGGVVCLVAFLAVRLRSVSGVVNLILELLKELVTVLLIYIVSLLGTILVNIQYSTGNEEAIVVSIFIIALLGLTCYISYAFAQGVSKLFK